MVDRELRTEIYNWTIGHLRGEAASEDVREYWRSVTTRDYGAEVVLDWLAGLALNDAIDNARYFLEPTSRGGIERRLLFLASDAEYGWQLMPQAKWILASAGTWLVTFVLGLWAMAAVSGEQKVGAFVLFMLAVATGLAGAAMFTRVRRHGGGELDVWPFLTHAEYNAAWNLRGAEVRREVEALRQRAEQMMSVFEADQPGGDGEERTNG